MKLDHALIFACAIEIAALYAAISSKKIEQVKVTKIQKTQLEIGMSPAQAQEIWGPPESKHLETDQYHADEFWFYGYKAADQSARKSLFFRDGKLISFDWRE